MNVLHICDFAAPIRGNFMEEMDTVDSALKLNGGKNIYAFTDRNIERKNQWVTELAALSPVYIYPNNPIEQIKLFRKIITEQRVDIIHMHFTNMKTDFCVDLAALGKKVKFVKHYRSGFGIFSRSKRFIGSFVYRNWFYICISPAILDECNKNFPNCKSRLILNPISFKRLDNFDKLSKQDIIGDSDGILCFMLGYNYRLKGIDLAAEAVSKLRKSYNIYLAVCVTTHLDEIKEELKNQFGGEIPEWIKLLPPRNDIASYYRTADICISPSRSEGACSAVVEEAYCEKITVASDCAGQYSYVNGLLDVIWFKNKDAYDLAKKLEEAISFRDNRDLLARNKQNAVKYYGLDRYKEQIIDTYNRI